MIGPQSGTITAPTLRAAIMTALLTQQRCGPSHPVRD